MSTIQLKIENSDPEKVDILIALLSDLNFSGFEEQESALLACIDETLYNRVEVAAVMKDFSVGFSESLIEPKNWNSEWESSFHPVVINNEVNGNPGINIRASFHTPNPLVEYEIIINPKMSFGTGHHATTSLMMQAMLRMDLKGKEIFDFGTGTGILSILAEKMGASEITANDCDEWSLNNAAENITLNNCKAIKLEAGEAFPTSVEADVILANINLHVIIDNLGRIASACRKESVILFSGILKANEDQLTKALNSNGITVSRSCQSGDWIMLVARITD